MKQKQVVNLLDPLLTLDDVVKTLKVSRQTINRWSKAGKFPRPRTIGRNVRWLSSEINTWIAKLPKSA